MNPQSLILLMIFVLGCQSQSGGANEENEGNPDPTADEVSDAGMSSTGLAVFQGDISFPVKTVMAFAQQQPDGGIDSSDMNIAILSVTHPCQHPRNEAIGPGWALAIGAVSPSGPAKGVFSCDGQNAFVAKLNPDGGTPIEHEYVAPDAGTFSIQWETSPASGVTGDFQFRMGDGGTLRGYYSAVLCLY